MELSERIKVAVLAYWKFKKHHMVGAIECKNADVFTISRSLMTTETEVKISITDMQREVCTKYSKHRNFRENRQEWWKSPTTHYFYFATPEQLQEKAMLVISERYPYAGLLVYSHGGIDLYNPQNITLVKKSKRFNRTKVSLKELMEIASISTNTAMKYINKTLD